MNITYSTTPILELTYRESEDLWNHPKGSKFKLGAYYVQRYEGGSDGHPDEVWLSTREDTPDTEWMHYEVRNVADPDEPPYVPPPPPPTFTVNRFRIGSRRHWVKEWTGHTSLAHNTQATCRNLIEAALLAAEFAIETDCSPLIEARGSPTAHGLNDGPRLWAACLVVTGEDEEWNDIHAWRSDDDLPDGVADILNTALRAVEQGKADESRRQEAAADKRRKEEEAKAATAFNESALLHIEDLRSKSQLAALINLAAERLASM